MTDLNAAITAVATVISVCINQYFLTKRSQQDADRKAADLKQTQGEAAAKLALVLDEHVAGLRRLTEESVLELQRRLDSAAKERTRQTADIKQRIEENTEISASAFHEANGAKLQIDALSTRLDQNQQSIMKVQDIIAKDTR